MLASLHESQPPLKPLAPAIVSDAREEGEVPESELDPNTRRRLLILQHGQDTRDNVSSEPVIPAVPVIPVRAPLNPIQPHGSWFPVEEEMSPRKLSRGPKDFAFEPEPVRFDKSRPFFSRADSFNRLESQRVPKEVNVVKIL